MSDASDRISMDQAKRKRPLFVGIDVGGTNIKVGLVDDSGRTLAFDNTPSEVPAGPQAAVERMAAKIDELVAKCGAEKGDIAQFGLATPGTMDIAAGMLLHPHNLPGWEEFAIRDRLSEVCGLPVSYNNDANAAAYGEYWVGRGREYKSMVLLTLGTGVGGGIIIDGEVLDGEHSHGAECGHLIIDYQDDARVCPCGQPGHLEGYASATAVVARACEALETGAKSTLKESFDGGVAITAKMIYDHALAGDQFSLNVIADTALYLAVGITTLLHVIDPDAVVLGGAMDFGGDDCKLGRRFIEQIREQVRKRAFPVLAEKTVIDFASLGGDAGYLGAAGIARAEYLKKA